MATQLNTTELDFKKIKENLKSYLKNSDNSFKDYDFEGSGLNHLLDILAYNTHYNAVTSHMAVNESFIDTAQIRANVVSHAKLVGYTPRSQSSASSVLAIKLARTSGTSSSATLSSGTTFSTSVDGVNYTFQTLADAVSNRYNAETNNFEFDAVTVYEGTSKTVKFLYNNLNNEKFVLPDANIDTSTLKVIVKDSATALSSQTYSLFSVEGNVTTNSAVYYLSENYDELFQVEFGNNVFGKRPIADSVIEMTYLISNSIGPNGASTFTLSGSLPSNTSLAESNAIVTVSNANGGADRESIESIQFNAPRSFVAQNRAVTLSDYEVMAREALADIQDVAVYGGQSITPPQHGKVFLSIKPKSSLFLTEAQKKTVIDYLEKKKIVTVTPVLVDADYTYIYFNITSKYDSSLTSLTKEQLESSMRSSIMNFNTTFLQSYGGNFRYSKFLNSIDSSDSSISGSIGQVYCYKRLTIRPNDTAGNTINFGFRLLGDVTQTGSFINTTGWVYNNKTYYIEDVPIQGDSEKRNLRRYYVNESNVKVVEDASIGFLYPLEGRITLNSQNIDSEGYIDITAIPLSYDIPGVENKLLTIDLTKTLLVADSNLSTNSAGIVPNSYINVNQSTGGGAAFNPTASGVFVPHTMYDPATGIAYYASTEAEHLRLAALGYVHYIPANVATSIVASDISSTSATSTGTAALPASYASGQQTTTGSGSGQGTTQTTYTPTSNPTYTGY